MTDTNTLAPTDAEIFALEVAHTKRHETRDCTGYFSEFDIVAFTLSAIAKWGAPAPVAEDAEDGARFRAMVNAAFTGFDAFERIMHDAAAETEPETIDDFRALVDKARAQAAQPEGGAKP